MALEHNIDILSFNCNGLGDFKKRKDVFDFIRKQEGNIYLLQETHWKKEYENFIRSQWGYDCIISGCSTSSNGVAILFKNNFEYKINSSICDKEGKFIIIDIEMMHQRIILCNIYGPSQGDKPTFFSTVFNHILSFDNDNIIIGGDWNIALNPKVDSNHPTNIYKIRSRKIILDLMEQYDLVDIFRTQHGDKRKYTWKRFNGKQRSRIDFFIISSNLSLITANSDILFGYLSDHSIIKISLRTDNAKRHQPHWKFNKSLLRDPVFVNIVKKAILDLKIQYSALVYNRDNIHLIEDSEITLLIDDQLFFEMILMEIRGRCISYSAFKKKEANKIESKLLEQINILENEDDQDNLNKLEDLKQQLSNFRQKKIEGSIIRSRVKWIIDGEKNSKYFCNLEKRNFIQKSVAFLERDSGEIINDTDSITKEAKLFYENLYAENLKNSLPFDNDLTSPTLSEEEKNKIEGEITTTELLSAIKSLNNDKSPGSDGFTSEFFKFFYNDLNKFLLRSLNFALVTGQMSVTQRQGIIVCIPKEGKDKRYLKNWRPITLLNTVYKIAATCIAQRFKSVLQNIISEDQKGFLKDRYIGENIRLMYDTLYYTQKLKLNGLLLLVDFEKAFDSINWSFIQNALIYFNFGENIRKWITVFYKNITSCVFINGQYSEWFKIFRGTRQGDPLSPYLFLLCAEILALMIKKNKNIIGININGENVLLSQFADDTAFYLDGSEGSFDSCMQILKSFALMSGLKINFDKTIAVWLGKKRKSQICYSKELKIIWNPDTFKYLGVIFSTELEKMPSLNYEPKLAEIHSCLNSWSKRKLTPFGKIVLIKTLAASKLTHLLTNLPDPSEKFLSDLNNFFFKFLWDGKCNKIKRTVTYQSYQYGGLKMLDIVNFTSALKLTWLQRILKCEGKVTKLLFTECKCWKDIMSNGLEFVDSIIKKTKNAFWINVLKHYKILTNRCKPSSSNELLSECLYYNPNIKRDNKCLFMKQWYENGIKYIGHLIGATGYLTCNEFEAKYPNVKTNFLVYNGIIEAIKSYQEKHKIKIDTEFNKTDLPIAWRILSKNSTKSIYNALIHQEIPLKCTEKWSKETGTEVDTHLLFTNILKTTKDKQLRWLQYRIIYRILPTEHYLFTRKIINSNECTFCKQIDETISHLFWDCRFIQNFWERFLFWLKQNFKSCAQITLSKPLVLFGFDRNSKSDKIIDLFIMTAKNFIFSQKIKKVIPHINTFTTIIKQRYQIEKQIAINQNSIIEFNKSWEPYQHFFM